MVVVLEDVVVVGVLYDVVVIQEDHTLEDVVVVLEDVVVVVL